MEIGTLIIAAVVIFIAWKLLTGLIKFGMIAAVVIAAFYFLSQGGF